MSEPNVSDEVAIVPADDAGAELAVLVKSIHPVVVTLADMARDQAKVQTDAAIRQAEFALKQAQLQAETTIRQEEIRSTTVIEQAKLGAKSSTAWNVGMLSIVILITLTAVIALFTGHDVVAEKLLFAVIGVFGGYGLSRMSSRR